MSEERAAKMKEEPAPTGPVTAVEIVPDEDQELYNRRSKDREHNHLVKRKRGLAEPEPSRSHRSLERFVPLKSVRSKDEVVIKACPRKQKSTRLVSEEEVTPELDAEQAFNAAQALYALFGGVPSPIPAAAVVMSVKNVVHWTHKRQRSSRSRKPECADKPSDSSTRCSEKPPVLDLFPTSYTPCSEVIQTGSDLTKQEEDTVMEERSGVTAGVGMDLDSDFRLHKPSSESSLESMQPNSRAESPSSPLPALKSDATLLPKLEKGVIVACSAFQQVTAMPPIKTLSVLHQPKVEENIAELTPVAVAPNLDIQRKPRPPQHDRPSVPVKTEDVGLQLIPSLGVLPTVHGGEVYGHPGMQIGSKLINLNEAVKPEVFPVKLESRQRQRSGAFVSGKLKPAMSEEEKEARRLRRVQANRESARQTIRRKQMLCEQLVQKATSLSSEKEDLKKKLELQTAEYKALLEVNHRLKEQASLLAANGMKESPSSTRPGSVVPMMPVAPYTRLPLPQFWWAFALAQVAAVSQASAARVDRGFGSDYSSVAATATTAATAALNAGISQDVRRAAMSSVLPFAANLSGSSYFGQHLNVPALSEAMPVAQSTSQPSSFLQKADTKIDGATKRCKTGMGLNNAGKHILCSPLEDGIVKSEEQIGQSKLQVGRKTLDSAFHQSLPLTGMVQPSFKVEGRPRASSSLHPGDTSSYLPAGQMPHMSKLVNPSVFSSFGGIGVSFKANCMRAPGLSGAAAAATEARRRRKELKRSRSLQSRQVARLANTHSL